MSAGDIRTSRLEINANELTPERNVEGPSPDKGLAVAESELAKGNRMQRRILIALGTFLLVGCTIFWLVPSNRPASPQLAQDIAEIARLIRDRIGQQQTNCVLSIDVTTDRARAFIRAVSNQTCTTYEVKRMGSEWRNSGEQSWALPCPLSQQDTTELTRFAWSDVTPKILPLSLKSIPQLPSAIAQRWSNRVLSLDASTNGVPMAQVRIGNSKRGTTYRLQKVPGDWQLVDKRVWVSQ